MRTDSAWSDDVFQVPATTRRRWPYVLGLAVLLAVALMVAKPASPPPTSGAALQPSPPAPVVASPVDELEPLPVITVVTKSASEHPPHATLPPIDPLEDRR